MRSIRFHAFPQSRLRHSTEENVFDGVAAIATNDVWAVGYNEIGPLTAHWDGTSWTAIANPTLLGTNSLFAVSAVSTSNVWAVGQSGSQVLTEQWDGTSWNVVTAPTPANSTSSIFVSTAAIHAQTMYGPLETTPPARESAKR